MRTLNVSLNFILSNLKHLAWIRDFLSFFIVFYKPQASWWCTEKNIDQFLTHVIQSFSFGETRTQWDLFLSWIKFQLLTFDIVCLAYQFFLHAHDWGCCYCVDCAKLNQIQLVQRNNITHEFLLNYNELDTTKKIINCSL